jgi:uncharacterized protein
MLIRLTLANFLSFRDETSFSMLATREKQHAERVYTDQKRDLKILPIAALYGANGSGKSNFYRLILFIRDLVLDPAQNPDDQIPIRPFRLDSVSEERPSRFSIEVLTHDNSIYRLTVAVTAKRVIEEKLELVGTTKDRLVYSRSADEGWTWGELHGESIAAEERDFLAFKARDTLPNQLFLGVLRGRSIRHVDPVIEWFRKGLQLMTPNTVFKQLEINLQKIAGLRQYCIAALRRADTGIASLARHDIPLNSIPLPENVGPDMEQMFRKVIPVGNGMLMSTPDGDRFTLRHEEDGLHATRLTTVHRTKDGRKVEFFMSDESDGTQRFVDLLPAFYDLVQPDQPKVFVIDEIDRSLHTELTRSLLEAFLQSLTSHSRSQLIFTTHDVMLLDQEILRRDEIWFAEKDEDGNSKLVGLSDFKGVRADKDIRKSYLLGRFGGMPRILGLPRGGIEHVYEEAR